MKEVNVFIDIEIHENLSFSALWAKKDKKPNFKWIPLAIHLSDAAHTAMHLWDTWTAKSIRNCIASGISSPSELPPDIARRLAIFLAASHDIAKASPVFQAKPSQPSHPELDGYLHVLLGKNGFALQDYKNYSGKRETLHATLGQSIFRKHGMLDSVGVVIGGHHGAPPNNRQLRKLPPKDDSFCNSYGEGIWEDAQKYFLNQALAIAGLDIDTVIAIELSRTAQVLLSAIVVMSDWIASNKELFPLIPLGEHMADSAERADFAFSKLNLPTAWKPSTDTASIFIERFKISSPHEIQEKLLKAADNAKFPGIFILEAPMGGGKTEAALAAAEILAGKLGCRGVYFALPTQATSNAMFSRALEWINTFIKNSQHPYNVRLAHGRAEFNDEYAGIPLPDKVEYLDEDDSPMVAVHDWFTGRNKGMLADFTIGTIDHVLQLGLKRKYLTIRHLGLSSKVIIIDECHAYSCYMESYLLKTLNWLGAYKVPVIVLSATLPAERRQALINSYLNNLDAPVLNKQAAVYPQITYTDRNKVISVKASPSTDEKLIKIDCLPKNTPKLDEIFNDEAYVGVILNTVKHAQKLYEKVAAIYGKDMVTLLHAGFTTHDRNEKEKYLIDLLGKKTKQRTGRRIFIGTQIFEQSMDIDFDVLVTELCPIDLLLQRIGRLHRHDRPNRPVAKPVCYVINSEWGDFDRGTEFIYGKHLLMRTRAVLQDTVSIPNDIPRLVEAVYDGNINVPIPPELESDAAKARDIYESHIENRRSQATAFQISCPALASAILGWLDNRIDDLDAYADAQVRDGTDSIEVVLVQLVDGKLRLLPWIPWESDRIIPHGVPHDSLAKAIAGCMVRLPMVFNKNMDEDTIKPIKESMKEAGIAETWQKSKWLKDTLCLILDEEYKTTLNRHVLSYSREMGLVSK